jgi:hypothetical protein
MLDNAHMRPQIRKLYIYNHTLRLSHQNLLVRRFTVNFLHTTELLWRN